MSARETAISRWRSTEISRGWSRASTAGVSRMAPGELPLGTGLGVGRIGIHDLQRRAAGLRRQACTRHEHGRSRGEYRVYLAHEFSGNLDTREVHGIRLRSGLAHVPRNPDAQPVELTRIRHVGIGAAARARGEHQRVTLERCVAADGQTRASDLDAVAVDDDAAAALTEHDADRTARRQLRLPTIVLTRGQRSAVDGLTSAVADGRKIAWMIDLLRFGRLVGDDDRHAHG